LSLKVKKLRTACPDSQFTGSYKKSVFEEIDNKKLITKTVLEL